MYNCAYIIFAVYNVHSMMYLVQLKYTCAVCHNVLLILQACHRTNGTRVASNIVVTNSFRQDEATSTSV